MDFQIGEYRDKILCDVAEMDAFHLLLGGPWKYDVDLKNDGKKNFYKLTKDGVQYTMTPLPDDGKDNHVVTSVMLVEGGFYVDNQREGYPMIFHSGEAKRRSEEERRRQGAREDCKS